MIIIYYVYHLIQFIDVKVICICPPSYTCILVSIQEYYVVIPYYTKLKLQTAGEFLFILIPVIMASRKL